MKTAALVLLLLIAVLRSCVRDAVDVLGSLSQIVHTVSVDVKQRHWNEKLLSPTEATTVTDRSHYWGENEHLYGLTPSHVPLKTTNDWRKGEITHHTQTAKRRQKNLKWEGVTDSTLNFKLTNSALNFKLTGLPLHGVLSVWSFRRHARCTVGKEKEKRDFPYLKINTTQ